MRNTLSIAILAGGLIAGAGAPSPVAAQQGPNTLWLGNSLVRFHADGPYPAYDLTEILADMRRTAARAGRDVPPDGEIRVLARDGFGLVSWWESYHGYHRPDGEQVSAARAIVEDPDSSRSYADQLGYRSLPRGEGWDRIVCLSLVNHLEEDEHWHDGRELVPAMERWYRYIREQDADTEILHYVAPADSRKIGRRQGRIDALFEEMRERFGGRIVPVGRAFLDSMRARPRLVLRRPRANDFLHYSPAGAYLAAAVFYAVLYGSPVGLPAPSGMDLSDEDARFLQETAQRAVQRVGSAAP